MKAKNSTQKTKLFTFLWVQIPVDIIINKKTSHFGEAFCIGDAKLAVYELNFSNYFFIAVKNASKNWISYQNMLKPLFLKSDIFFDKFIR